MRERKKKKRRATKPADTLRRRRISQHTHTRRTRACAPRHTAVWKRNNTPSRREYCAVVSDNNARDSETGPDARVETSYGTAIRRSVVLVVRYTRKGQKGIRKVVGRGKNRFPFTDKHTLISRILFGFIIVVVFHSNAIKRL